MDVDDRSLMYIWCTIGVLGCCRVGASATASMAEAREGKLFDRRGRAHVKSAAIEILSSLLTHGRCDVWFNYTTHSSCSLSLEL